MNKLTRTEHNALPHCPSLTCGSDRYVTLNVNGRPAFRCRECGMTYRQSSYGKCYPSGRKHENGTKPDVYKELGPALCSAWIAMDMPDIPLKQWERFEEAVRYGLSGGKRSAASVTWGDKNTNQKLKRTLENMPLYKAFQEYIEDRTQCDQECPSSAATASALR